MENRTTKTTIYAREQMAKARASGSRITKNTHIALGEGGTDSAGNPIVPTGNEQSLKNQLIRKPIEKSTFIAPATMRYEITLSESELVGRNINEMALVDEAGKLTAIRTMYSKRKDGDMEFGFEIDDMY
ncbi:phage tail-collar fiber domain-containing protein [Alkalicoccobacillus gibsonii]|uniref:phage tail-collar fiber domain-containing protein n=1 Tax=Alkalicoccobacillus gibsonii TaxID=79881 RepID=UPI00193419C0|nr:phage tail protein [Alkalicoccobacillus gibsonii]MBM0064920.1 phage tail protein [Alkalicoccobacillus gibsonii]